MPTPNVFDTYSKTWQSPYTHAVSLTPAMGVFPPTRAIIVQKSGILVCLFADSTVPVSVLVGAGQGLLETERMYRIVQVISLTDSNGNDAFSTSLNAVVGLY